MAKIIITSEDQAVREVELKERMTLGRRPHNDIVIDHRAVSGEHATITVMLDDAILEDLGSTNGTFVNGEKIYRHKLNDGDRITVAKFDMVFMGNAPKAAPTGRIEVLSGVHAGKKLSLSKPLTTLGKPGSAVLAITYASGVYSAARIDGELGPSINGKTLEEHPRRLVHGDMIDLSGTRMTFLAR